MQSKIETQVMASVATIYTARQLLSATALKLYVCVAALFGLARLVWVERVFDNLANVGLQGMGQFALAAVLNTDILVQFVLLALVFAGLSLVRDLARLTLTQRSLV